MFGNTEKETYTFDVTHKTPEWGKALTKQLTEYFGNISKQLSSVDANCLSISKQLADFKTKVENDIQKVDQKATEALDAAIANKAAIAANEVTMRRLERELVTANRKCNVLEFENERLTAQNESQESYSRRDNLIISGIKEQPDETPDMCISSVRHVLVQDLKLDQEVVNNSALSSTWLSWS